MTIRVDKWKLERWILEHGGHMNLDDWQLNQLTLFEKQNKLLERIALALEGIREEVKRVVYHETRRAEEEGVIPP